MTDPVVFAFVCPLLVYGKDLPPPLEDVSQELSKLGVKDGKLDV